MAYPFKNNLNISYQEAMVNGARSKAMGDYDAINVDSEELIDYTPSFQEQYNADMAKVASNNERIKELEAIIAQKKQDEINFSRYRNNPLYKAAKFDYVVTGNRSGLDQFLADERAREEMVRQTKEAELNRQNAIKLANMQKEHAAAANSANIEDRLAQAKLAMDQAYRMYKNDEGNQNLKDVFEKAQLTYNQLAIKAGQETVDYLKKQEKQEGEDNPSKPNGEGDNNPPAKSKADTSKDYMAEIKQATDKGDYNTLKTLAAELNDDAHKNETQYNDARTAVNKAIVDIDKKNAANRKAAEDKKNAEAELNGILNGTHNYSDKDNVLARAAQLAKKLGKQTTYGYDRKTGKIKEYLK